VHFANIELVNVISRRGLMAEAEKHPETIPAIERFCRLARKSTWNGLNEVRQTLPSADQVGSALIFNILGNSYRLITSVNYARQEIFVKALLTHREYDRKEWMKWA
jgi:mRNA interferase HigB